MDDRLLDELRSLLLRHAPPGEGASTALPSVVTSREPGPVGRHAAIAQPMLALVAQGRKRIEVGHRVLDYAPGEFLICTIDMPMVVQIPDASPERPFVGMGFALDPARIAALLLESGALTSAPATAAGVAVSPLPDDLGDAVVRLLRLLDKPADIPVLGPAIEREILWRLLGGPQGGIVRQIGLADSHMARIARAIRVIRSRYAGAVRIEALSEAAGMSVTSFYRHFRAVTGLTPIQFQKQLRLQEARARLMAGGMSVADIGFSLGYDSPSQFSREYRRQFGRPPGEDGASLRSELRS